MINVNHDQFIENRCIIFNFTPITLFYKALLNPE